MSQEENTENESITVSIGGHEISIKADGKDPGFIQSVAAFVDQKTKEMAPAVQSKDSYKIVLLAALNIAGELFEAREQLENQKVIREKTEALEDLLAQV